MAAGAGCAPSVTRARSTATWARWPRPADGTDNVLVPMKEALRARATVGEVCDVLRGTWGVYVPPDAF